MSELLSLHDRYMIWAIRGYQTGGFTVEALGFPGLPAPPEINGYVPDLFSWKGERVFLMDVETEQSFLSEKDRCKLRRDAFKRWEAEDPVNRTFMLGIAADEDKGEPNLHTNWDWRVLLSNTGMPS